METSDLLKKLTAPWNRDEIKWRVGSMNKDKTKALPLAYVDARVVMERLDNVMGALNWQDRYEFADKRTMCYLSLRFGDEWLCKSDGAGDSDIEGEKGGISDAFKRAAVKWGMGRELYELKCKWMPIDQHKQLDGDPWDFVIGAKKKATSTKQEAPKKETPEGVADRLIAKINEHKDTLKLVDWERNQKVIDARDKLFIDNPALSKKVDEAIKKRFEDLVQVI